MIITLHQLAALAQDRGDYKRARMLFAKTFAIEEQIGSRVDMARTAAQWLRLEWSVDNLIEAYRLMHQALSLLDDLDAPELNRMVKRDIQEIEAEMNRPPLVHRLKAWWGKLR